MMRSESKLNKLYFEGGRTLTEEEYAQLESRFAGLSGAPLYIDDTPGLKLSDFHEKAKNLVDEKGGRPEPSQLRESGAMEEAADSIILIHRPDFIGLSDNQEDREKCIFTVAKNRNGKLGDVSARFHSDNLSFT